MFDPTRQSYSVLQMLSPVKSRILASLSRAEHSFSVYSICCICLVYFATQLVLANSISGAGTICGNMSLGRACGVHLMCWSNCSRGNFAMLSYPSFQKVTHTAKETAGDGKETWLKRNRESTSGNRVLVFCVQWRAGWPPKPQNAGTAKS